MITAELKLHRRFIKGVELNVPGVPEVGQFVTLHDGLVNEKTRDLVMNGAPIDSQTIFQITRVEWTAERLHAPARMVVHMDHKGGV